MIHRVKNNTKNIGKRNVFFNKIITIKVYDGLIEKQIDINPGDYVDIIHDNYSLPTNIIELEKKGLLNINIVYDTLDKPIIKKTDNIESVVVPPIEKKSQKNNTKKKNNR